MYHTIQLLELILEAGPTRITFPALSRRTTINNRLPRCLITMQRKPGANGYFANERFGTRDATEITDEIALNPAHALQTARHYADTLDASARDVSSGTTPLRPS